MRQRTSGRIWCWAAAALSLCLAGAAAAAPAGEKIAIDSKNYEGIPELLIGRSYLDVKMQAYLSIPDSGVARYPAVVIVHDTFGVSDDEFQYARDLNGAGFATLVLDEYADRKLRSRDDPFNATRAADALFALKYLAANPKVDPKRIAVVGFSRGGVGAYLSAIEPVRRAVLGSAASAPRFAAHAAFYPGAPALIVGEGVFSPSPIRFFFGRDDSVAPVQPWLDYFALVKAANVKWAEEHVLYDGGHGFERSYVRRQDRGVVNSGRCPPTYYRVQPGKGTELFRLTAGKLVSMTRDQLATKECTLPGGSIGRTSDSARAQSHDDLIAFLNRSMPAP